MHPNKSLPHLNLSRMPRSRALFICFAATIAYLSDPANPASAQSVIYGGVSGQVVDLNRIPVGSVSVTLENLETGLTRELTASRGGAFRFEFISPGTYELRAEAIGYRPLVGRTVTLEPGTTVSVELPIRPEPPPITRVDTVDLGALTAPSRTPFGGEFGLRTLAALPDAQEDLAGVASLASDFDDELGAEGLPGQYSVLVADGLPFYSVMHPRVRGDDLSSPLFPRSGIVGIRLSPGMADVEWTGGAGSYLVGASRSSTMNGGPELDAGWSGDALWSSSQLDFDAPSLTSMWGSARAGVDIVADTSRLFIQAEGFSIQRAVSPRLGSDLAQLIPGLEVEEVSAMTSPGVEEVQRASGQARLDWAFSPSEQLMVRAGAARQERSFTGPGPTNFVYGSALPEERTDFSVAATLISEIFDDWYLEVRTGLSGSDRVFDASLTETTLSATRLIEPLAELGLPSGLEGSASRVDFIFNPVFHHATDFGTIKGGGWIRASDHEYDYGLGTVGEFLLADETALDGGPGVFVSAGSAETSAFNTNEIGGFFQAAFDLAPGVQVLAGIRYDWETTPEDQPVLNEEWLELSGLPNILNPRDFGQWAGHASLLWDLSGTGRTLFFGTASMTHGDIDPGILHELFSQDGRVEATAAVSQTLSWPSTPSGAQSLPTLALMGEEFEPPRTSRLSAGLKHRLSSELSIHVSGVFRRTDFLPRRRDLNLAPNPSGVDQHGREIHGELFKFGGLVGAEPGSNRRFSDFDAVWAFDSDGWSEYRGLTVALDYATPSTNLFASYTKSETEDNWVGARRGWIGAEIMPGLDLERWDVGVSDFDVPDRVAAGFTVDIGSSTTVGAVYRFRSGLPFTPGYRIGVDVNGDGSTYNDVAFIPGEGLGQLTSEWPCLSGREGGFAVRNSCRGPSRHSVDARVQVRLASLRGSPVRLFVDAFNLIEDEGGFLDEALLLVDPAAALDANGSGSVAIPTLVNPDFGKVIVPSSTGRFLRIGLRIGG